MTRLLSIAILFIFLGCDDNYNPKKTFLLPDEKDINDIVEAVVNQDSMPFLKTNIPYPIPLSLDLRKIRVTVPDTATEVPPPVDHTTISIFNLFNSVVDYQRFFERTDSSYFLFQNNSLDSFIIDKTLTKKLVTTTFSEQRQKTASNLSVRYYDLTIPILSTDHRKAYIELTNNCSDCGGATAFYLEKINSKWTVVGWQRLWMN
ncbi:MAG: hypothetical protein KGZ37_02495 [Nitrosarchaeum sp.]|nr:hypothetical protein [Nitrosarchaeum sp.]